MQKQVFLGLPCRCSQIMGRNETDELSAAQIFYPCMQCADIFFLKVTWPQMCPLLGARWHLLQLSWVGSPSLWLNSVPWQHVWLFKGGFVPPAAFCSSMQHVTPGCTLQADICQLGMDQRKVNMLAREYCDDCRPKRKLKPIILSHEMLPGLLQVRPGREDALHSCLAEQCIQWLHQLVRAVYPCALQRCGFKLDMSPSLPQSATQHTGTMRSISPDSLLCIAGARQLVVMQAPTVAASLHCIAGAGENVQE